MFLTTPRMILVLLAIVLPCPATAFAGSIDTNEAESIIYSSIEAGSSRTHRDIDIVWVLICAVLVFVMQAGFMCFEAGLSRAKNSIHVAFKNVGDLALSVVTFWLFGFGVMFGSTYYGWFGTSMFSPSVNGDYWLAAFFVFQAMFCGTVSTIDSGAVAERASLHGYILTSKIVCALIYPIFGHWVWGGLFIDGQSGWLASLGFMDFGGATVVHSTGGWVALAGIMVVGARIGKFKDGKPQVLRGHNMPLMLLGMFILFFGWFGFNCGSTLAANGKIASIAMNTLLSGCFAGFASYVLGCAFSGKPNPSEVANGTLGGLVAITAGCFHLEPFGAAIVGVVAAVVVFGGIRFVERQLRLDDVVGAVAVHGFCGAWGTLALALLIPASELPIGFTRFELLGVQALGVSVCFAWSFGMAWLALETVNWFYPLRVSEEAETLGLNISEHNASSGFLDLQRSLANLVEEKPESLESLKVEPEIGTEVGDLAVAFNSMLESMQAGREELFASSEREELLEKLVVASREAGMAEIAVGMLHNVGNALTSLSVSTGVMRSSVESSSVSRLRAAYTVLDEQRDDLADFLTKDGKGKYFLDFLCSLCDRLDAEAAQLDEELATMASSVEHLKSIVSKQEEYANLGGGMVAPEPLPELVNEAVKLMHNSLVRHGVELTCECDEVSLVMQDRRIVLQVLKHLLTNAVDAVVEHETNTRLINVRVWEEAGMVCCSVQDTGVGISEENTNAIFGYGFSTRKDRGGRGFGLHTSANAVQEMGGRISVHSNGPGTGATFTIQIPAWTEEANSQGIRQSDRRVPGPHKRMVSDGDDIVTASANLT
jgi:Amt family ammonium transporter